MTPNTPTPLPPLSLLTPTDKDRLNLLFRVSGDTVSFMGSCAEPPLDLLNWLTQPHIKPWHESIQRVYREAREADTQRALSRSLSDLSRVLDIEANASVKIRAINSIVKLANALHRSLSSPLLPGGRAGEELASHPKPPSRDTIPSLEQTATEDSLLAEHNVQRTRQMRAQLDAARRETDHTLPVSRSRIRRYLENGQQPPIPEGMTQEAWAKALTDPLLNPSLAPAAHTNGTHRNGKHHDPKIESRHTPIPRKPRRRRRDR